MTVTVETGGTVQVNPSGTVSITTGEDIRITGLAPGSSVTNNISTFAQRVTDAAITGGATTSVGVDSNLDSDYVGMYCIVDVFSGDAELGKITGVDAIQTPSGAAFARSHSSGVPVLIVPDLQLLPEYWGAEGNDSTDNTSAIQRAIDAADANGGSVIFGGGVYLLDTVTVNGACTLIGRQATLKQRVLASNTGSPIINVTAANVTIDGLRFNGQAASQPADGYSDSFAGGTGGTGRAYRAAIKCDGHNGLTVRNCDFTAHYGACIAAQDCDDLTVTGNYMHDSYFEAVWLSRTTGTNDRALIANNRWENIGSGHGSVNANGLLLSYANGATISGNTGYDVERNHIKLEFGTSVTISGNTLDYNQTDNFAGIQIQSTSSRITITGNTIYNCGAGIDDNGGTTTGLVISGNVIDTTTGTSTGDGIKVGATSPYTTTDAAIVGNVLRNIVRHGIHYVGGDQVTIANNEISGQAGSGQLAINFSLAKSCSDITVSGNRMQNFSQSAVASGVLGVYRTSAFTFTNLFIRDNHIDAGGSANRGLRSAGDYVTGGEVSGNTINGQLEYYSDVTYRNNTVNGTVTWPVTRVEFVYVGGPGNSTKSPTTDAPTDWVQVKIGGTDYYLPAYTAS